MKQFMAVLVLIASIVVMSCAGASGGDDGAVNGYIPLVGGNLPRELQPSGFARLFMSRPAHMGMACISFPVLLDASIGDYSSSDSSENIFIFVTNAPIIDDWSSSTEPISTGDTFTYNYLGESIILRAEVNKVSNTITNEETGEVSIENGYEITYHGEFDPNSDGKISEVTVTFNMLTKKVISNQIVYYRKEEPVQDGTTTITYGYITNYIEGTWSETEYDLNKNGIWKDYRSRDNGATYEVNLSAFVFYRKTPNFFGIKRIEDGGSTIYIYHTGDKNITNAQTVSTVWTSNGGE